MTELNTTHMTDLWKNADAVFSYIQTLESSWSLIQHVQKANQTIKELQPHVDAFSKFKDVIILGTGGSSLGGQALTALATTSGTKQTHPTLHFLDNIDSATFQSVLTRLDPLTTGVISISKSGNTAETLMQTLTLLQTWKTFAPKTHMRIITEPKANAMREVATAYDITCIDHPVDVGGRFSVFTCVALLPAMIVGIDVARFCAGANESFLNAINATVETCPPLAGALMQVAYHHQGISQSILMAYANKLGKLCEWFAQLWAESLGKKNDAGISVGTTPIKAIGTVDQHSQLQLYLDGPRDKFFTILTLETQTLLSPITLPTGVSHPSITAIVHHSMGELMIAEQKATIDTLRHHGCPIRHIELTQLDAHNLGSLMMYFMLETLAAARFWNVNPFNQPAVEDGKVRALDYLAKMKQENAQQSAQSIN